MAKRNTPTRRERWAPYVRQLADILRLRDWRVDVYEDAPSDPTASASCNPIDGRKFAVVRFAESFLNDNAADQRHTIAHELLHCMLGPLTRMIEAREAMSPEMKLTLEYTVDGLADAIAPLLPMPPASTRSQS